MFSLWFEGCRGFVHICSSKNWPGVFLEIPASAPDDPLEPSFRGASRLPDGYFSTCTFKSETRRANNVKDIPGIWADLDFKRFVGDKEEADERLKRIPFEPSILVCSGSGYHAFWRFCQPQLPSHETIALLKHFTEVLHGDPATTHYAALLRIPGTINSKYGQTRVEIDRRSSWKTYSLQEVLSFARKSGLLVDGTSQDRSAVCVETPHPRPLAAIPEKFHKLLEKDQRVRNTWEGNRPDLWDRSRSGFDVSMTAMLVNRGYSDAEVLAILRKMPSGKGKSGSLAYFMHGVDKIRREKESDRQLSTGWKVR